ncbi:uncharacterized protein EMH_0019470 [Eimeria mitis]|uniref:Uncharacterized protein n=1 Tax=Eimeria mitis TaxID=44415 RepID=U6KFK8_9EIME|nr:uncharacterized protein EMH_0019470 [Eimeria mitis]CDJ34258.1 hypothetical protein EMH_0019470 [Eimeria mitis]
MGPPQPLTPRPLAFPNERMATSFKEPVDESLPSSSRDSPGSWQLPLRVTLFQYSGSVVQSAPVEELPTDATVISHFRWLGDLFPGIPPEVLRTHPFYRHPQRQPPPTRRSFTEKMVLFYAKFQKLPNPALTECREIMKKSSLTLEDFEELVSQAERLCGYAIESMPVAGRRPHPLCVLEALGTIFLVLDTLYCAAEVLGENSGKQWWWPWIVSRLEHARFEQTHECSLSIKSKRNSEVAHALSMALEYYRRGIRPPMIMVIGLKEALFCEERISKFKAILWRAWKEDAEKWRESIKPDVAGSK